MIILCNKGCGNPPAFRAFSLKSPVFLCFLVIAPTRKAVGEKSRKHEKEVYDYVMSNKKAMPRTALRYAIELMPKDLKAEAMKKDG